MLGRTGSGCTSLAYSLQALRTGVYPKRHEKKAERDLLSSSARGARGASAPPMPPTGGDCGVRHMVAPRAAGGLPLVITDAQLNGPRSQVRLPGGRRLPVALRSHSLVHDAVLFLVDATDRPLWEDPERTEELGQLCATLRHQQYTVVIAVTKLYKVREDALKEIRLHGDGAHGGKVGRDPRRSYEEFVSRYVEKTCVTLQATEALKTWLATQEPGAATFPKVGATILDVPTWISRRDFEDWQERRGTIELPNLRYTQVQLEKLAAALALRPEVPAGTPWHQLVDDEGYRGITA